MKPSFFSSRRAAINEANRRTKDTGQQHECYRQLGWLVRNQVTKALIDADGTVLGYLLEGL